MHAGAILTRAEPLTFSISFSFKKLLGLGFLVGWLVLFKNLLCLVLVLLGFNPNRTILMWKDFSEHFFL